jgi:3'-phosphoadenosine 5'-phosphosulfate sulfotransferase (PAPS reductase)/FAD synthetase
MQKKIDSAKKIISFIAKEYKNPVIYSGMGKDSICVVHLCRSLGFNWDIMFHRDPFFPEKYKYANRIISEWGLVCRDYPAHRCSIFYHNDTFEVVRHYQTGVQDMVLCAMLYEPDEFVDGKYLCALKDIYLQPKGNADYIWDIGIQGHKAAECKPHSGMKPNMLRWPFKHCVGGPDWAQPIWDWTEEDVCQYILDNDILINDGVYERKDGRLVPVEDSALNPDRRPACFRCMRPDNPMVVTCPKTGLPTNNISESLERVVMPNDFPRYSEGG